ncbi:PREDICTED: protein O-GlcNAcase-like isoform X2 [Priapulus caudatus]|uniref:Protein O-GlcNAcase-like isoform X2 n=1 Tax=Priapulus caudatus TaxID=37621 RepID=A0ABM1DQE5_PRICU|nr:PREDICTED: protein O-GlcNAcase-like isoform X2 [Priapulus caudatus]
MSSRPNHCVNNRIHPRTETFLCGVVEGFYGRPWTAEQRKELFKRMHMMGLNTYMYAPKDDYKHRAYWRELYSVEEADLLTSLITAAKDNGVQFVYALSPGLDITFSSAKEVACLKRKLEQVSHFGCRAFALLFDDIEADMCEADKAVFQSFAYAQVSVTNEVFQHLEQPRFLFCPTEYCASRAVPNVPTSEYLNTIGSKLLPGVDILWTGPKVVSRHVSVESIEEITEVMKRPPVIWDNVHANDYDQKRLFLGPYDGRSTDLIPCLNGVLTNPNCEFEMNYVAMHTLAQWSRSNGSKKESVLLSSSPVSSDIKLETEGDEKSDDSSSSASKSSTTYIPRRALRQALKDWLEVITRHEMAGGATLRPAIHIPLVGAPPPPSSRAPSLLPPVAAPEPLGFDECVLPPTVVTEMTLPLPDNPLISCVNTCVTSTPTTNTVTRSALEALAGVAATKRPLPVSGGGADPADTSEPPQAVLMNAVNSLAYEDKIVENVIEPMDCASDGETAPAPPAVGERSDGDVEMRVPPDEAETPTTAPAAPPSGNDDDGEQNDDCLLLEDMEHVVDMFYLPFEHGAFAVSLLEEFHWLKSNSHLVNAATAREAAVAPSAGVQEWRERASAFEAKAKRLSDTFTNLTKIRNRALVYDLYPYMWDMKGVISLLLGFVKWLGSTNGYREAFMSGEQEPWVFRGGLQSEFQRMLPIEGANDLFTQAPPTTIDCRVFTIRPYLSSDEDIVYDICVKTCDDGLDGSEMFLDAPRLIGDKFVGGMVTLSPEYSFVVDDDEGPCGYMLAVLDSKEYFAKYEAVWIPEMRAKYPAPNKTDGTSLTPSEEIIMSFYNYKRYLPSNLYNSFPSIVRMSLLPRVSDVSLPKRMMACVLSAVKANGSKGAYCEVSIGDKHVMNMYTGLGFFQVTMLDEYSDEVIALGRPL